MIEYYVFGFQVVYIDCDYVQCIYVWGVVVGVYVGVGECYVVLYVDYW